MVVLDVTTGAIVAAYSNPTFDPNPLASHDTQACERVLQRAERGSDEARARARVARDLPARLDVQGRDIRHRSRERARPNSPSRRTAVPLTVDNPVYPELRELDLPQTDVTLANFGGNECGGTLAQSFRVSCNTTFAQIGLDLGDTFASGIEQFGVEHRRRRHRPAARRRRAASGPQPGTFQENQPLFAQAGDRPGRRVAVTPLADGDGRRRRSANGGVMMTPHVLDHVENTDGEVVRAHEHEPHGTARAMQPATAATVRDLMVDVVNNGTGTARADPRCPGRGQDRYRAGARTSTRTRGSSASRRPKRPAYAIAVIVENGGTPRAATTQPAVASPRRSPRRCSADCSRRDDRTRE